MQVLVPSVRGWRAVDRASRSADSSSADLSSLSAIAQTRERNCWSADLMLKSATKPGPYAGNIHYFCNTQGAQCPELWAPGAGSVRFKTQGSRIQPVAVLGAEPPVLVHDSRQVVNREPVGGLNYKRAPRKDARTVLRFYFAPA